MHPLKTLTALVLSAALTLPAFAAPTTYTADPNHTFVDFGYNHMGFSNQLQRFNKTTGTVTYDPAAKTASVDMTIDVKSVDAGSPLTEHIQGAEFFDTAQYPTATFKSTSVKFDGDKPVSITGNLTLKGITKPVTLKVTWFKAGQNMMKREALGANATGTIKRSEFNMTKYVPMVSDDVTLTVAIEAAAGK